MARDLLGRVLCRRLPGGDVLRVRITEVEAYVGVEDRACHSYGGRRTARTATMWGPAGHAYVYLIYGMYDCLNIVSRGEGHPEAVLIRAAEPLEGEEFWNLEFPGQKHQDLLKGPGKLCRALRITRAQNAVSLLGDELWIEEGVKTPSSRVSVSPRIGVDYAGACAGRLLRFFETESKTVSGPARFNQEWKKSAPAPRSPAGKSPARRESRKPSRSR
ncbi:MAG: DNA-3-methyladenine glycosylase [Bdellovibrionaceae bacterium]|nr:DNA-3-methyladenine glycosylase [Pseudobdellovibrionaceae bacterium]MBX3033959.1 DNA-3-methyladenine glycosylase [Pseudobdellovibrionaceae bacterium]